MILVAATCGMLSACDASRKGVAETDKFDYTVEQFADLQSCAIRCRDLTNSRSSRKSWSTT